MRKLDLHPKIHDAELKSDFASVQPLEFTCTKVQGWQRSAQREGHRKEGVKLIQDWMIVLRFATCACTLP